MAFLSILEYGWLFTVNSYLLEKNVEIVTNEVEKIKRNMFLRLFALIMI
jgi:hypothetical protein